MDGQQNDIFNLSGDFKEMLGNVPTTDAFKLELPDMVLKDLDDGEVGNVVDKGVDIKESLTKKKRLIDPELVNEFALKFGLSQVDTNNLKKINSSDAINVEFFLNLRKIITEVEIKSKIMDLFNIRKSYTGFHDWYDGHRIDLPSVGMDAIATNMGYSLMIVPVKNTGDQKHKNALNELQSDFLNEITKKVSVLVPTEPKKNKNKEPEVKETSDLLKFLSGEEDFGITEDSFENKNFIFDKVDFVDEDTEPVFNNTVVLNNDINIDINEDMNHLNSTESYTNQWDIGNFDMVEMNEMGGIDTIDPNNLQK